MVSSSLHPFQMSPWSQQLYFNLKTVLSLPYVQLGGSGGDPLFFCCQKFPTKPGANSFFNL